jgi:hypothetical protein
MRDVAGPHELPFGDLDSLEAEGWALGPGEDNLPLFTKVCLSEAPQSADGDSADQSADAGPQLELSRPALLELQAFELALLALSALAGSGDLRRPDGAAAQPGGAGVRAASYAARGQAEEILVGVQILPPGGGVAVAEAEEPGTYL